MGKRLYLFPLQNYSCILILWMVSGQQGCSQMQECAFEANLPIVLTSLVLVGISSSLTAQKLNSLSDGNQGVS